MFNPILISSSLTWKPNMFQKWLRIWLLFESISNNSCLSSLVLLCCPHEDQNFPLNAFTLSANYLTLKSSKCIAFVFVWFIMCNISWLLWLLCKYWSLWYALLQDDASWLVWYLAETVNICPNWLNHCVYLCYYGGNWFQ